MTTMSLSACCTSNKSMENCEIMKVLKVVENNESYYMHVRFNHCTSKDVRENLIKEELTSRFPLIRNKTIRVEEYFGKKYNEYKYEIEVEQTEEKLSLGGDFYTVAAGINVFKFIKYEEYLNHFIYRIDDQRQCSGSKFGKSIWGLQIGIPNIVIRNDPTQEDNIPDIPDGNPTNGIMFYNETKLTGKITVKTEGGLGGYFRVYNHVRLLLTPTIAVEPRFYFKSQLSEKSARGDFIALNINYNPNLFTIRSNWPKAITHQAISIAPFYAVKGGIGKSMNYEIGGGVGYCRNVGKISDGADKRGFHFIVQLRLGYEFPCSM